MRALALLTPASAEELSAGGLMLGVGSAKSAC